MKLTLPKPYLSWSSLNLWSKDKEQFRARYYRNEKLPDTPYTIFGRAVHDLLENDEGLNHIPRYPLKEVKLQTVIEGVPILGYIDSMEDSHTRRFIDYKSSIRNPDGSSKWTELEVQKLDQLPFYSMLIYENYAGPNKVKKGNHRAKLIWLETQWKQEPHQFGSCTLIGDGSELELSGYYEVFERVIEPWERQRMKEWVVKNAQEISDDYSKYYSKYLL